MDKERVTQRLFGLIMAAVILFLLSIWGATNLANATEQAVISFNDAEHREVLIDSVLAVRDTTWEGWWPCLASDTSIVEYSDWLKNIKGIENATEKEPDSCYIYLFRPLITCRELVRVKIIPMIEPSKAIVLWKKVFIGLGEYDPFRGK